MDDAESQTISYALARAKFGPNTRERRGQVVKVEQEESLLLSLERPNRGVLEELISEPSARWEHERRAMREPLSVWTPYRAVRLSHSVNAP